MRSCNSCLEALISVRRTSSGSESEIAESLAVDSLIISGAR